MMINWKMSPVEFPATIREMIRMLTFTRPVPKPAAAIRDNLLSHTQIFLEQYQIHSSSFHMKANLLGYIPLPWDQ